MRPFNKRLRHTGELFTSRKADINELMKFCNLMAEKVDELVTENNKLHEIYDKIVFCKDCKKMRGTACPFVDEAPYNEYDFCSQGSPNIDGPKGREKDE